MCLTFEATEASFDADEYALVCSVGSDAHYLTFQRETEGSREDWGVHLEYDDQSDSDYGCVASCRLSRSELRVDLSWQLGTLAGVEGFAIGLHLDERAFDLLKTGLVKVFRGLPDTLVIA